MILAATVLTLLLCLVAVSAWAMVFKRHYYRHKYKVLFKLSRNPRTILSFKHRTDLTGAYAQLIVYLTGLAVSGGRKIFVPAFEDNYTLRGFERQSIDYENVSANLSRDDHIANNSVCIDKLGLAEFCTYSLPENVYRVDIDSWKSVFLASLLKRPVLFDIGGNTNTVYKLIKRGAGGLDNVFTTDVRAELFDAYARKNVNTEDTKFVRNKLMVCIHARHGEICDMPKRFIPSVEYRKLLSDIRTLLPDSEIHLYSVKWCDGDSQDIFLEYGVTMHVDDVGVYETWKQFMLADILVIARSSFSFVPALMKNKGVVLYRKFWYPPLSHWVEWDASGVSDKEKLLEQIHSQHA